MDTILTVDAGTTRLKAALLNEAGDMLAFTGVDMTVLNPFESASEMQMDEVWKAFAQACHTLSMEHPEEWKGLKGIGITGQGDGFWPLDAQGKPCGNAILWNDSRSKRLDLPNEDEINAFCVKHALSPLFAGAPPTILRWVYAFEPERYQRVAHVIHCKDWLVYNLTGRIVTDRSDASTALMNILTDEYEFELLTLLGLPAESAALFPEIVESSEIVGRTNGAKLAEAHIPEGVPVIAGALDGVATVFGAGAQSAGDGVTILGTTFSNHYLLKREEVDHTDTAGSTLSFVFPELFVRVMANSNGASAFDWARNQFAPGLSYAELETLVTGIAPGAEGLFFLPYLNGERAPFRDPKATGQFSGFTSSHHVGHIMRAVLEGLAYSIRDCYSHLPFSEKPVILAGGVARSDALCQILANCLNRPMSRVKNAEFGLLGIGRTTWEGLGRHAMQQVASSNLDTFMPEPSQVACYGYGYKVYRNLREQMAAFWTMREDFIHAACE